MAKNRLFFLLISIFILGYASLISAADSPLPVPDHNLTQESASDNIEFDYSPRTVDTGNVNVSSVDMGNEDIDFDYTPRSEINSPGSTRPDIECAFANLDTLPHNQAAFCRLSMGVN